MYNRIIPAAEVKGNGTVLDHYDDFDGFEDAEDYFDGMHGY